MSTVAKVNWHSTKKSISLRISESVIELKSWHLNYSSYSSGQSPNVSFQYVHLITFVLRINVLKSFLQNFSWRQTRQCGSFLFYLNFFLSPYFQFLLVKDKKECFSLDWGKEELSHDTVLRKLWEREENLYCNLKYIVAA